MNLLILFVLHFSVLVGGHWQTRVFVGEIREEATTCHDGAAYFRRDIGAQYGVRFESMACIELRP